MQTMHADGHLWWCAAAHFVMLNQYGGYVAFAPPLRGAQCMGAQSLQC